MEEKTERRIKDIDECMKLIEEHLQEFGSVSGKSIDLLRDVLIYMKETYMEFSTNRGLEFFEIIRVLKRHEFSHSEITEILKGSKLL